MTNILYLSKKDPPSPPDKTCVLFRPEGDDLEMPGEEHVPHLALLDLDHPRALDYLTALREYFTREICPIWGFNGEKGSYSATLFKAMGGNRRESLSILWPEALSFHSADRDLQSYTFPVTLPLNDRESMNRLMEQYRLTHIRTGLAEVSRELVGLEKIVQNFFHLLEQICHPHLIILLINDHLTVEAFVQPADSIFREDYLDFRNFCLSDLFRYFQGLDLENPREHIFLNRRKDFNKISMERRKISSYLHLPLKDARGNVFATIHLGHLSNNYFSNEMIIQIEEIIKYLAMPLSYTLRCHQTEQRKQKIFHIFSHFVPPDIIPQLVEHEKNKSTVRVSKQEVTVLFCDIRSFTTITESNGAQQVVEFLNRHFEAMVGAIQEQGGSIDKFIGDAIVAFFGVPSPLENSSLNALKAAMKMVRNLIKVDTQGLILPEGGYSIGVGLHRGEAIVGNIGSEEKSDYTAIGDVIEIAEELEAMTKGYPGRILASQTVYEKAAPNVPMKLVDKLENGTDLYIPLWEETEGHK